jgi:hypothetical protein
MKLLLPSGLLLTFGGCSPRAIVVRGNTEQASPRRFCSMQCKRRPFHLLLDKATKARPRLSYRMPNDGDNIVRVFYLPNTETIRDF